MLNLIDRAAIDLRLALIVQHEHLLFQICNMGSELIKASLGISKDRIYIGFDDVNASDWGWNGRTFG